MESHDLNDHIDDYEVNSYEDPNDQYEEEDFEEFDEDSDEDPEELARRKARYAELKKDDKIFNNTYNMGYDVSEDDAEEETSAVSRDIRVDSSSPDFYMYDKEQYAEYVDQGIIQREIFAYIEASEEVNRILGPEPEKKKFVKSEINDLFTLLCNGLITENNRNYFITPIYVLDALSIVISTEYKKLFDMLNYENKEILLLELNSKYGFLDKLSKSHKMF